MGVQENVGTVLRMIKEERDQSMAEFAEELEMARSVVAGYLNGSGNPSAATIDHMAKKLGIDPVALTSGFVDPDQGELVLLLFRQVKAVAELSPEKKRRFAELFLEMMGLWN